MQNTSRIVRLALSALPLLVALAGCTSSGLVDPRTLPTAEISGEWDSTATVGSLGTLHLELVRREDTRIYDAEMTSANLQGLGESLGVGTLADNHLILDFGPGETDEYYFEGNLVTTGKTITGIDGQLVFPDQSETLPVTFSYTGPLSPSS